MDLFDELQEPSRNLLEKDGIVNYYGTLMSASVADTYFNSLYNEIDWKNDKALIFGKQIVTKRKVAWYGDKPFKYTYSNTTKLALPWNQVLKEMKALVEQETAETYNSCLLNLYHDGSEGMAWHSDAEEELKKRRCYCFFEPGRREKILF